MTPDTIVDWAKAISILGAIIFGGFAVFSPSWVWFRLQAFKWGSGLLLGFGTVLLVSPIFRNVQFTVDTKGLDLRLNALHTQISQVTSSVAALTDNFEKLTPVISTADMKELDRKIQTVQTALTAIESELPKLTAVADRVKRFEQTAAAIDKNTKLLNEQTVLLANYINTQQATADASAWNQWTSQKYPAMTTIDLFQPNRMENIKKYLGAMRKDQFPGFDANSAVADDGNKATEAGK